MRAGRVGREGGDAVVTPAPAPPRAVDTGSSSDCAPITPKPSPRPPRAAPAVPSWATAGG